MKLLVLVIAGWAVGVVAKHDECSGFRCPPGEQCELLYPPCRPETPVCNPIPVCRRVTRPGTCPAPSDRFTICLFQPGVNCISDLECDEGEKCCPEGCGSFCAKVIDPVIRNPCEGVRCPPGEYCRERPGPGGINQAQCFDPCREARCRFDQRCELQTVFCIRAPCPPIGVCVDRVRPTVDPRCAAILCPVGKECRAEPLPCLVPPCPTRVGCFDPRPTPVTNPCTYVRCGPFQECRLRVCRPFSGDTCPLSPVCRPLSDDSPCPVGKPILSSTDSEIQCRRGPFSDTCPRGTKCTPEPGSYSSVCCLDSPATPPTLPPPNKPGTCPPTTGPGLCALLCSSDSSCPGNQKCCSTGCGTSCQPPRPGVKVFGK